MNDEIIIEFSRTKAETKKIFFRRLWLKQVMLNIILGFVLIEAAYLLGSILGVSLGLGSGFGENSYSFFTALMTLVILNFFFAPVYKLYNLYKKQINEMYGDQTILYNKLSLTKDKIKYENESYCMEALWSNTKMMKMDKDLIQFQTKIPGIVFWIPTDQVSSEAKSILLINIPKN